MCICGYAIAGAQWGMSAARFIFFVNAYFIFMFSSVIPALLKALKLHELTAEERKRWFAAQCWQCFRFTVFTRMMLHP